MKKKIYVVKRGEKTGIYNDYKKCEAQVKGFPGAVFLSFDYRSEFEKEDENKEGSLRHAFMLAEKYMSDINKGGLKIVYQGENQDYMEEESWKKDGFLPFGEEVPDDAGNLQGEGEKDGIEDGFMYIEDEPEDELPFFTHDDSSDDVGSLQDEGGYEAVNDCLARLYGEDIKDDINDYLAEVYGKDINDYLAGMYGNVTEYNIRALFDNIDPYEDVDVNEYLAGLVYAEFEKWKRREAELRLSSHIAEDTGMEKLDKLVGLAEVKEQIRMIAAFAKMKKDMPENGNADVPVALHMEFVGNPGTAKTTVARIVAEIFHEIGLLPDSELIEVGRVNLISDHVGGTAKQVKTVFKRAKGKVLFIDEAYSLADDNQASFGDEAINTIIQEMENNRDKTIVIFAGYPAEMERFFSRNPGLRSRVPYTIRFSDYSAEDMVKITELEARRRGFLINTEAYEKVTAICSEAVLHSDWGNGRFCRNLIEKAMLRYASRNYGDNDGKNNDWIFIAEDFPSVIGGNVPKKFPIGFHA